MSRCLGQYDTDRAQEALYKYESHTHVNRRVKRDGADLFCAIHNEHVV